MMSDLAEIAAAAGIAIIDSDVADVKDEEETDNKYVSDPLSYDLSTARQIEEWDVIFGNRYTMSDTEYVKTVETAEALNQPPCVKSFNCWRQRDDSRNWNRDRRRYDGDRGRHGNRGNQHNRWNSPSGDRGGSWGRDARQQQSLQNYGDCHYRGYGDQHRSRDNDRQNWGNDSYQNRSGYHQNRGNSDFQNRGNQGSQHSRNDSGNHQRHRDSSRGDNRERSPQR